MRNFEDMFRELLDLDDAMDKYEWIMDYGDKALSLSQHLCNESTLVRGCTSALYLNKVNDQFLSHSESAIVKGLSSMICDYYNQADEASRQYFELNTLNSIGLAPLLSMGRQNGVANLIRRLKELT